MWRCVPVPAHTVFDALNREFSAFAGKHAAGLPDFQRAATLLIGSDYSGEHSQSAYVVYSFLLTSMEAWAQWEPQRIQIRKQFLPDSRRMSFKRLGDVERRRALHPLLIAANSLEGLSFSLAVSSQCKSFFSTTPPLDLCNPDFAKYMKWKEGVLEKAFLILHILGLLLAGLGQSGQNVLWFTDEDNIAANDERVQELTQLFGWITSLYLTFNMGRCWLGTSRCDDGSKQIEDVLAIPDLIAGAIGEQLNLVSHDRSGQPVPFWRHRPDFSDKTNSITWWFSDGSQPLRRLLAVVDPSEGDHGDVVSWYHFHSKGA